MGLINPTLRRDDGDDGHCGDPRLRLLQSCWVKSEARPFSGSTGENGRWKLSAEGFPESVFDENRVGRRGQVVFEGHALGI